MDHILHNLFMYKAWADDQLLATLARLGDDYAAYCPATASSHVLNETAAQALMMLDPGVPRLEADLIDELAQLYDEPPNFVAEAFAPAWSLLLDTGLQERVNTAIAN